MLKITAIISLMFIVSSVWSSCDSCGSECASACGTRRFRTCCFNYLRKKRGPNDFKVFTLGQDVKETQSRSNPVAVSNDPISRVLFSENYPYPSELMVDNHLY